MTNALAAGLTDTGGMPRSWGGRRVRAALVEIAGTDHNGGHGISG